MTNSVTDQSVGSLNWSTAEVGTAIVCACLSAMRPLASKIFPGFFLRLGQSTSASLNTYPSAKMFKSQPTTPQSLQSQHDDDDDTFELIRQHPDS